MPSSLQPLKKSLGLGVWLRVAEKPASHVRSQYYTPKKKKLRDIFSRSNHTQAHTTHRAASTAAFSHETGRNQGTQLSSMFLPGLAVFWPLQAPIPMVLTPWADAGQEHSGRAEVSPGWGALEEEARRHPHTSESSLQVQCSGLSVLCFL